MHALKDCIPLSHQAFGLSALWDTIFHRGTFAVHLSKPCVTVSYMNYQVDMTRFFKWQPFVHFTCI